MYHFVHVEKILLRIKYFYPAFMRMCTSLYTASKNNGVFAAFSEFSVEDLNKSVGNYVPTLSILCIV